MENAKSIAVKWNAGLYNSKHEFVSIYGADLVELLQPKDGERILDVGCGSGRLSNEISQTGATVFGIDSSEEMISEAKAAFPHIQFTVASATEYQAEQPFDAIFSNAALHWILEAEKAVENMGRNLKPDGRLVIEMGGKGNVAQLIAALKEVLIKHGYAENAAIQQWYFPSLGEYCSLLEAKGFRVHFASHFDRETELKDSETGIKDWLRMFAVSYLKGIADPKPFVDEVQEKLRPTHYRGGKWYADYKRLRVVATKQTY